MPPSPTDLRALLDQQRPATVLQQLSENDVPLELAVYKTEALLALDRYREAHAYLDPIVPQLHHDDFAWAERLWAEILLRMNWIDGAILSAEGAARAAQSAEPRAVATAWAAIGHARKRCWSLAEQTLREARALVPQHHLITVAEARMRLEMDQRLEAQAAYEQLAQHDSLAAQVTSAWGRAHVAYLLGTFDEARNLAQSALQHSEEIVGPLFTLGNTALALNDVPAFEQTIAELERRSPQAEVLNWWKQELPRLRARVAPPAPGPQPPTPASRKRLTAFPTTVQRRDHCGPCTIELVLRYWKGGVDLTNDQIAQMVKFPGGGTPMYRMREFFHLIGFDTVRCLAPVDKLKQLIEAGYPAIIQQEYADSSHVVVVIGYVDDADGATTVIELQDPMTHSITAMPVDELNKLRRMYLDSAVVAFPRGQGHDKVLARLGLFDDAAVVWTDQAGLALDEGRASVAAELMARATQLQPQHRLSWVLWLHAENDRWQAARNTTPPAPTPLAAKLAQKGSAPNPAEAREKFYTVLARATELFHEAEFVHQFEGSGALTDGDYARAVEAYTRAAQADPDDSRNYASLAEAHFALYDLDKAQEAAFNALNRNTALPAANVWVARCQTWRNDQRAYHYARAALELAPRWWLSHLAQAEVHLNQQDHPAARRELDAALALAPNQLSARVTRGRLLSIAGDQLAAALELEPLLAQPLAPIVVYELRQTFCRILFGAHLFEEAFQQIQPMLALFPNDPWAQQFRAAARAQSLIHSGETLTPEQITEVRALYDQGIAANNGLGWVCRDYADFIAARVGPEAAVEVVAQLRARFPDNGALIFMHGLFLTRAGQREAAAQVFAEALTRADAIQSHDDWYDAAYYLLDGLGPEAGATTLLQTPAPENGAPLTTRERALGLVLAYAYRDTHAARALELLSAAVARDPEDSFATLRLGDVTASESDREALYRRALLLSPRWAYARARLADFLIDANRAAEALEFTDGHENDSWDVLVAHGRGLFTVGRYEEALPLFERAIAQSNNPPSWLYYYQWGAQVDGGHYAESLQTAQTALPRFPQAPLWYVRAAQSLRHLERFAEATQMIEQGRANGLTEAHEAEAEYETAWAKHDLPAALLAVEKLIQMAGEQHGDQQLGYWENKRLRLLLDLGRAAEARQMTTSENLDVNGWGAAAWTAMLAEDWAVCLEFAERTLTLDPHNFSGLLSRAEALRGLGREAEAVAAYHHLREAHPDEHNAYEKLALVMAVDNKLDDALALAERAMVLGPFCPLAWAIRGYVHFARGERAQALADLMAAWGRADPDRRRRSPEFWWILAVLQGQSVRAVDQRQKAQAAAKTQLDKRLLEQIARLI